MYCIKLVISILQNNYYSKFLKLLENNVNFLKQNICSANKTKSFIKKQNKCSANKVMLFHCLKHTLILDHLLPFLRAFILKDIITCLNI